KKQQLKKKNLIFKKSEKNGNRFRISLSNVQQKMNYKFCHTSQAQENESNNNNNLEGREKHQKHKKKKSHKSSRSRSHSQKKKSKKQKSSRSKSHRKHKHRSRSAKKEKKSKHQNRKNSPPQKEANELSNTNLPEQQQKQQQSQQSEQRQQTSAERLERKKKELEEQIERLNKEAEEATREDLTVMIYQLPTKADEKDIWKYLVKHCGCTKVRDIKIIRDQRTKKSKGVAYAEFYIQEDVQKALQADTKPFILKGEEVPNSETRVQHSQAEKNRAALAAKQIKQQRAEALKEQLQKLQDGPVKVFVGGLTGKLASMTDTDLRDIFQQYGDIESVELPQDVNGKCIGFGYIIFSKKSEAHEAINAMNNKKISDQQITVAPVSSLNPALAAHMPIIALSQENKVDLDQNENNIYLHTAQSRLQLMQKLAGNNLSIPGLDQSLSNGVLPIPGMNSNIIPSLNIANNPLLNNQITAGIHLKRPLLSLVPTPYVVLVNMFLEGEGNGDSAFFADLKEDVAEECKKFGDVIQVIVAVKSPCGAVFVIFNNEISAVNCAKNMDMRLFNQRQINCYCISEETLQDELQNHL
ncbi:splicing factor, putative, partial [Ichthyophthirius multifiliis]